MTPVMPKENPWLDSYKKKRENGGSAPASDSEGDGKKKGRSSSSKTNGNTDAKAAKPTLPGPHVMSLGDQEPPVKTRPIRRPPSRRIMRHVLRARIEAVKALAQFFYALEHDRHDSDSVLVLPGSVPGSRSIVKVKEVKASLHLARRFGRVERLPPDSAFLHPSVTYSGAAGEQAAAAVGNMGEEELIGWRNVSEVVSFLKARGGKIPTIGTPSGLKQKDKAYESGIDGEWAAALSDGEGGYSSPS
jgi:glycerol-3-phosphate O-acyltransferase / dihydroxyacetone phosphate acyltransferase